MKTYKNAKFTVVFKSETEFTVTNVFGDTYRCTMENGNIVAYTAKGLSYAMKAREQLGF